MTLCSRRFSIIPAATVLALALTLSIAQANQSGRLLPREHHKDGITWISGGIGKAQADAMRQHASGYALRLVMVEEGEPRLAFLGEVSVKITDTKGKAIHIQSGPLLFLKLPPGRYTVQAEVAGYRLTRSVTVKPKVSREVILIWPRSIG